ncbi:small-conductance mechanosensitive channel [Longilinea arvoryzae]|uniref:Small-conductance mechanosensitive channel n=1 Tax=Longilinea arvoryzae TaxID=360412 RepID=A0A0S7BA02_9CHLR|nr:mechanosensitive ion channel family protein [Longilinea arvoryzae]GAP14367.1 small-conductance mechanosensitive channel [Longilinea arvoryzae]
MNLPFFLDVEVFIRSLILVIFIFVLTQIVQRVKNILRRHWVERETDTARKGRIATSISVGVTTLDGFIIIGGFISLLNILGIDMTPILASLGIVGLALSLGAQALIKDFLAGLAILTEHQFAIGDEIKVGSVRGEVEEISMRATRIREYNSLLHIFPNSEVRIVANASHQWMRAIVDINLPYSVDLHQAYEVLKSAAARCAEDEQMKPLLLDPPEVIGWNGLSDWAVQVRLAARTLPGKQYGVQAILRRNALDALDQAGIPVALPTILANELPNPRS